MASAAAATADCIGPYRAIRQLGAGGMGEVFLAHDDDLGRNIAIKLLPPHLADDAEHLGRLRNEARSASSLNHPNIVTIYEIGRDDSKRAFMAMEYVDGQTLREVLRGDALPVRKSLQIAAQIADGLAAAHKRGLVHRDLKPENIMITSDGVVKILDFGLAKSFATTNSDMSEPGMLVGTYSYMSPEQARAGEIDYRSDQFSFGSILYEMLTGARAFDGSSGVETLFMVVRDEPSSLSAVASHVPAPLRWIVDRCLSKDPEDRYVSTRDLARDLQYLRDHFSEAGTATPIREKDSVATRIRKRWPVAAAIAFALVAGSLVTAWARRPEPRTITSERYLTYSGHDYSPAVSPDGKLIAFASSRDGEQRIWLKQVAGGSEVALTAGRDDFPRFSPDSSAILYIHADGTAVSLWRIPAVGGEARKILDDVASADFSRDGTRIAFLRNASGAARTDVWVADADGSNARLLAATDVGAAHPRWSPDGKQIAIVTPRGGRVMQSVILFDAATGTSKALATPPKAGEVSSIVWTADGRHVVYVRAESVEAVVGSSAKVVRHDVRSDTSEVIGWSSHNGVMLDLLDDGRIVLDARSPRDNLREIWKGVTEEKWITRGNSSDRQPAYAPDGKAVLFSSNRSGNLDLWLTTSDGGVRRLTDDASEDWDPGFTPDGKSIVWSSGRSGNLEIWIANADGSGARQISADGVDAENPSATPDGQWIVYCSFNSQKAGIWKVRADGTQATHLVKARTSLPEISPDGKYISYLADSRTTRAHIRVARVADGKDMGVSIPVRTYKRTGAILGRSRWMPDGKSIAFLAQTEDGINGVFVQDFAPGTDSSATKRPLGGFDRERATESFGIAPDGLSMTVAGWEQLFSIFSIEGLPLQKKES
ncbi:MAG TPA: LpqB family beta-propeller domain-containing protein [Thermoanaerobaculia bacterium]|nr:LpqB family beta-propeller domain-containing protein [Thermoanaerobaculia bacterium]